MTEPMDATRVAVRWSLALGLCFVLGAAPTAAQVIGTECWNTGGVMRCNSQVGLLYAPNPFAEGLAAGARFAQLWQQQQAVRDARRASRERGEAAARLYFQRVEAVVAAVCDSLRIHGEGAKRFAEQITPSLADLFRVNPTASRDEILEVLWPHIAKLNKEFEAFLIRVVPPTRPAVDSLALASDEAQLFVRALLPLSQDVFMLNPEATPETYRAAIQPLLERARVYFDSTRAARRP